MQEWVESEVWTLLQVPSRRTPGHVLAFNRCALGLERVQANARRRLFCHPVEERLEEWLTHEPTGILAKFLWKIHLIFGISVANVRKK